MMENTTEEKNSLEAKRISAAMWIVDYLECIFHHTLGECKRVIISGLGAQGCVEEGSECLTYVGKSIMDVHLTHRRGLEKSVYDGGIGDFAITTMRY